MERLLPADSHATRLADGDAAATGLEAAKLPGRIGIWADVLHEGPVRADLSQPGFRSMRSRYLASLGWATFETINQQLATWDQNLAEAARCDKVVIWLEHDLFDQLLLIHHLVWFAQQILADVAAGIRQPGALRSLDQEPRPFLGDTPFYHHVQRLAGGPRPLLFIDRPNREAPFTAATVTISPDGHRVLGSSTVPCLPPSFR